METWYSYWWVTTVVFLDGIETHQTHSVRLRNADKFRWGPVLEFLNNSAGYHHYISHIRADETEFKWPYETPIDL